jgi:hypothetical protein
VTKRNSKVEVHPPADEPILLDSVHQGLEEQNAMIAAPNQDVPSNQNPRIGCAYCFWTINPEDPDEHRRAAVRVGARYYHTQCWDQHSKPELVAVQATVLVPPPLIPQVREPVALRAGPLNTLTDLPLGISHSTLRLETAETVEFALRNNAEEVVTLSRRVGPPWVAVEYNHYGECSDQLALLPKDTLTVQVYPSFIRPAFMTCEAQISENQGIDLGSNTAPIMVMAVIVSFVMFWLIHIFSLYGAVQIIRQPGWPIPTGQLITAILSMGGMIALAFFMAASWLLWSLYALINVVRRGGLGRITLIDGLLERLQYTIWAQFARRNITQVMHNPRSAVTKSAIVGVVGGTVCSLFALLILRLLSPILFLVWLPYAGIILWLLYRFLLHYDFNGVLFGRRVYRFLGSLVQTTKQNTN